MSDDDKVGYKKPPEHSRFKPGQSGNPNGRPKGSKNKLTDSYLTRLSDIVLNEAHREIQVKENGETVSVEVLEAVTRSVVANAMKGVAKSQKLVFEIVDAASRHKDERKYALLEAAIEFKEKCRQAQKLRKKEGLPPLDIVPHPDDIVINTETGEVLFTGPITYSERTREDYAEVSGFEREIATLERELKSAKKEEIDAEIQKMIRADLKFARDMLAKVKKIYEAGRVSEKADWTFKAL